MQSPRRTPTHIHMNGFARLGVVIGVAAIAFVVWSVISAHRAAAKLAAATEEAAIVTVSTTHPQATDPAGSELVLPGSVQADIDAPIYARTSGYLKRWLVDIGARVKAGQLLAEIDTPEVQQQLSQAEADVANAAANDQIARVTAQRWQSLLKTDSVSRQDADEKASLADASRAQLAAARANLQRLRDLSGFQRIVAPFAGVITARETDVGRLITAGGGSGPELFRISDERQLRLYVRVPQAFAPQMSLKPTAAVTFPDHPGMTFSARLDSTSNAIDPATNTLLVQLKVDNARGELLPGAYADVHFRVPPGAQGPSLQLPANTLLFRSDGIHVATVDDTGHVVLKPIIIGRDYGSAIEVVNGLTPQDTVILSPPDSLLDHAQVRVVRPPDAGTAARPPGT
ncbi:MAG TPA: efflux RND transporter periplasmic adaptor subunit [Steroidobacteraceae bacterium]|nr:efflux RND transporter periplasmic adaptor subunit [Steroidobacteraceae bacterium]